MNNLKQMVSASKLVSIVAALSITLNQLPAQAQSALIGLGVSIGSRVLINGVAAHYGKRSSSTRYNGNSTSASDPSDPATDPPQSRAGSVAKFFLPIVVGTSDYGVTNHNRAVKVYNRGVGFLNQKQADQAIACFQKALSIDPRTKEAHHALACAFILKLDYASALDELEISMQQNRHNADLYYTAGDAALHLHNYAAAHKYYQQFLAMGGKGDRAELAKRANEILDKNYFHTGEGDYLADATKEGVRRWSTKAMPLKVYVDENSKVTGYKPEFANSLREAFGEWSNASNGKITFTFVSNAADADIKCGWTSELTKTGNTEELGLTHLLADSTGAIKSAVIDLYTLLDKTATDTQILKTAKSVQLHEIGHALGLAHSQEGCDIMFPLAPPDGLEFPLSIRDKQTIASLYAKSGVQGSSIEGKSGSTPTSQSDAALTAR